MKQLIREVTGQSSGYIWASEVQSAEDGKGEVEGVFGPGCPGPRRLVCVFQLVGES